MFPSKLQSGQLFKPSVVATINQIIDYLKTQRLVTDNKTLRMIQSTNGITLTAIPQGGGGGSYAEISNTYSGGGLVTCIIKRGYGDPQNIASGNGTYLVTVYPQGIGKPSQQGTLVFGDYALNSEIPSGAVVMASPIALNVVQGS